MLSQHYTGKAFVVSGGNLLRILLLANIPWYSEFLLVFFLIKLLVLVLPMPFRWLSTWPRALAGLSAAGLLTALALPADLRLPNALGLLVGTRTYFVFPLVQYLPVFLAGLHIARQPRGWHPAVLGLAGTGAFVVYYLTRRALPPEFLPSVFWLVGSYGPLCGYYGLATWLERRRVMLPTLLVIGQHTLLFLILSNVFLFALHNYLALTPAAAFGTGLLLIGLIYFLLRLVNPPIVAPAGSSS